MNLLLASTIWVNPVYSDKKAFKKEDNLFFDKLT
jgi:hypothetical protein